MILIDKDRWSLCALCIVGTYAPLTRPHQWRGRSNYISLQNEASYIYFQENMENLKKLIFDGLTYVLCTEQGFVQLSLIIVLGWIIKDGLRGLYSLYLDRRS